MAYYRVEIDTRRNLPSMAWLCDVVSDALEKELGMNEGEYDVVVHGPTELRIVVRDRR